MAQAGAKRIASVYAEALLEAVAGANAFEAVRADVESLRQLLADYPAFAEILAAPHLELDERERLIRRTFQDRLAPLTLNFLLVLNRRWRLNMLDVILAEYIRLDDERTNRRQVEVLTAVPLDEALAGAIKDAIARWGGFEPVLETKQDETLLGGLLIRIGDQQIDASVRGQLQRLRAKLKDSFAARVAAAMQQGPQA